MNTKDKMNNMKWGNEELASQQKKNFPGLKPWQGGKRNFIKNATFLDPHFPLNNFYIFNLNSHLLSCSLFQRQMAAPNNNKAYVV